MELGGASKSAGGLLMEALELLRNCFPAGGGVANSFVALSGKHGLRWILPTEFGSLSGLLAAWQPYSTPAKVGWGLIRFAAKGGFLSLLPGVKKFDADLSAADWRDYGWSQTEPPAVIAYVGTPGEHRKLVVILADRRDGAGHLVVKCPLVDTAWAKIEREYSVLGELRDQCQAIAPRPVLIDRDNRFTVQTYLVGRPVRAKLTDAHFRFLGGLYRPETKISLEEVRDQIIYRRDCLMERVEMRDGGLAHLERLLHENCWQGKVPGVRIHGDFAPWNLKLIGEGTILAVDWEDSQPVGLPFNDLQFYEMQTTRLLGKKCWTDWSRYVDALVDAKYPKAILLKTQVGRAVRAVGAITILENTYSVHTGN